MKTWEIRYYLNEVAYRTGIPAFKETIKCDRNTAVSIAQAKMRHSQFKFFDLIEK